MIEFLHASVRHGRRLALDDLSLRIAPGERWALVGRSGAGKSTALKTVNRIVETAAGEVRVQQRSVLDWDPIALRRSLGYVIQEGGLFPHFSVARNIGLIPRLLGWDSAAVDRRVGELLEMVDLAPARFAHRFPHQLSGGERQRVGLARALAARPGVLLLDEPFGALDPITRFDMQAMLLRLQSETGVTLLLVTHDIQEALRLSTHLALLGGGRLLAAGTPAEASAVQHPEVQAYFRLASPQCSSHEIAIESSGAKEQAGVIEGIALKKPC